MAARFGINPKTVAKWRRRDDVTDRRTGPREPRSTVLTTEEEAIAVASRRHTLLALDDCLYALQATIPHLTRSSLHRCFQRHGVARLSDVEGDWPARRKFKAYPIGYFHIDIAEVRTQAGKLYLFVAIDRTSKVAIAELHEKATRHVAASFLRGLIATIPYRIHTVLTDNGIQFCDAIRHQNGPTAQYSMHLFKRVCCARPPWGQEAAETWGLRQDRDVPRPKPRLPSQHAVALPFSFSKISASCWPSGWRACCLHACG